jgi:hypothetical protein
MHASPIRACNPRGSMHVFAAGRAVVAPVRLARGHQASSTREGTWRERCAIPVSRRSLKADILFVDCIRHLQSQMSRIVWDGQPAPRTCFSPD